MARRRRTSSRKTATLWTTLLAAAALTILQQNGKPVPTDGQLPEESALQNVSVASVYDGDTFKINLNCSLAVYCEKVPVRVRGVDCPEIKGKTKREKRLAQKAKAFTKNFLQQEPISLSNCGRDKYFRLLCSVKNAQGQDLAEELIRHRLGYAYDGGKKSDRYR